MQSMLEDATVKASGSMPDSTLTATFAAVERAGVEGLFDSGDRGPADE